MTIHALSMDGAALPATPAPTLHDARLTALSETVRTGAKMTDPLATHAPEDSGVPASARDFSVKDRVVIITGAGQGIGREFARQFAAAGAIACHDGSQSRECQRVARGDRGRGGRRWP